MRVDDSKWHGCEHSKITTRSSRGKGEYILRNKAVCCYSGRGRAS